VEARATFVATIGDSTSETKLKTTYNSTEYGTPNNKQDARSKRKRSCHQASRTGQAPEHRQLLEATKIPNFLEKPKISFC
jgi:hypothetical protein